MGVAKASDEGDFWDFRVERNNSIAKAAPRIVNNEVFVDYNYVGGLLIKMFMSLGATALNELGVHWVRVIGCVGFDYIGFVIR